METKMSEVMSFRGREFRTDDKAQVIQEFKASEKAFLRVVQLGAFTNILEMREHPQKANLCTSIDLEGSFDIAIGNLSPGRLYPLDLKSQRTPLFRAESIYPGLCTARQAVALNLYSYYSYRKRYGDEWGLIYCIDYSRENLDFQKRRGGKYYKPLEPFTGVYVVSGGDVKYILDKYASISDDLRLLLKSRNQTSDGSDFDQDRNKRTDTHLDVGLDNFFAQLEFKRDMFVRIGDLDTNALFDKLSDAQFNDLAKLPLETRRSRESLAGIIRGMKFSS